MMSGIRWSVWAVGMVTAMMCLPASAAAAVALRCGDTVTRDVVLRADLTDCPDVGLQVGADNVTVDLDGHTIAGANSLGEGVKVTGFAHATIADGAIRGFDTAVLATNARGVRVRNMDLSDPDRAFVFFKGVAVFDSTGAQITGNRVSGPGFAIGLNESPHGVVAHNTVAGTDDPPGIYGIFANFSDFATVAHNTVSGYRTAGIDVGLSAHDRVVGNAVSGHAAELGVVGIRLLAETRSVASGNRLTGNGLVIQEGADNRVVANDVRDVIACDSDCGVGITFRGGTRNLAANNAVTRTAQAGISVEALPFESGRGNILRANVVRGAAADGISVGSAGSVGQAVGTVLKNNSVTGAGDNGVDVHEPTTSLTANVALFNRNLGFAAVPGILDGGGNRVAGNGNPLQCVNLTCRAARTGSVEPEG